MTGFAGQAPLVSFTGRDPPATLIPVHMRIRSPQAMIKPSTALNFGTDKSTETLTREQVFYEALGSRHINERQQLKEGGGIAFIRVGAVGIESGKYLRYFPDSGQEEKAISPPLTFAAFTEPDPLFNTQITTPEREGGYIALGVGRLSSDPKVLLVIHLCLVS